MKYFITTAVALPKSTDIMSSKWIEVCKSKISAKIGHDQQ